MSGLNSAWRRRIVAVVASPRLDVSTASSARTRSACLRRRDKARVPQGPRQGRRVFEHAGRDQLFDVRHRPVRERHIGRRLLTCEAVGVEDACREEERNPGAHEARNSGVAGRKPQAVSRRPVVRAASQVYSCPQVSPLLVLITAVLATTYSGPIVRFATAPAVAIAFWRSEE